MALPLPMTQLVLPVRRFRIVLAVAAAALLLAGAVWYWTGEHAGSHFLGQASADTPPGKFNGSSRQAPGDPATRANPKAPAMPSGSSPAATNHKAFRENRFAHLYEQVASDPAAGSYWYGIHAAAICVLDGSPANVARKSAEYEERRRNGYTWAVPEDYYWAVGERARLCAWKARYPEITREHLQALMEEGRRRGDVLILGYEALEQYRHSRLGARQGDTRPEAQELLANAVRLGDPGLITQALRHLVEWGASIGNFRVDSDDSYSAMSTAVTLATHEMYGLGMYGGAPIPSIEWRQTEYCMNFSPCRPGFNELDIWLRRTSPESIARARPLALEIQAAIGAGDTSRLRAGDPSFFNRCHPEIGVVGRQGKCPLN